MEKTAKKKWSKKKKVWVIILCIVAFLFVSVLTAGAVVLHMYCKTAEYNIVETSQDVNLIAHRGYRAVAPENTPAAFAEAGKAGFAATECDVYRTKDGVWVVSHDRTTYRMMDKSEFVEKITFDEFQAMNVVNGSNIENYPNLKVCTLEDYLKICKEYGMRAVIELKGPNNTEHYDEIIELIDKYDSDCMFISFHLDNLKAIRELSDAPVWFLVKKIDDEAIENALTLGGKCGIDFDYKKEENNAETIQKCIDKGLEVGAWTVNDEESMNRLLDLGVKNITTDCIIPE